TKKRFFIMPFLLPDWGSLEASLKDNCSTPRLDPVQITLPLEFFRESVRDEVARIATKVSGSSIQREQIWMYPYAWLYVEINAASKIFSRRFVAQYPTSAKDFAVKERALRITAPEPIKASFSATCDELKSIFENRDISGKFYAPYTEMKK